MTCSRLQCRPERRPEHELDAAAPQVAGRSAAPLGFWELLTYIVDEPAPMLPSNAFSPELRDFVAACLQARLFAMASTMA